MPHIGDVHGHFPLPGRDTEAMNRVVDVDTARRIDGAHEMVGRSTEIQSLGDLVLGDLPPLGRQAGLDLGCQKWKGWRVSYSGCEACEG